MKTISCIIPAYNEAAHIATVLETVISLIGSTLTEVIVIDDCSTDDTKKIVEKFPMVRLLSHQINLGKSRAVADGIDSAVGNYILLLDADLAGLTTEAVLALIAPVQDGVADFTISYRKNAWPLYGIHDIDYLSGERVIERKLLLDEIEGMRVLPSYGLEVFMNRIIIKHRLRVAVVPWIHVENTFQTDRVGLIDGILSSLRVWMHVFETVPPWELYQQNWKLSKQIVPHQKITFSIPAYNEEKGIVECLESIVKETAKSPVPVEIIVVNNASTDRTKELALTVPGVRVVDEMRKGIVWARQAGFQASTGELIANIDADNRLTSNWLATVLKEFKDQRVVAVSGPLYYYDLPWYQRFFTTIFYVGGIVADFFNGLFGKRSMLQGGNYVVRRDALVAMGGYDTSIVFHGEDTDIGRRAAQIGKIRWTFKLPINSSGRRLAREGLIKTGWGYAINFFSVTYRGKPRTEAYEDIRL